MFMLVYVLSSDHLRFSLADCRTCLTDCSENAPSSTCKNNNRCSQEIYKGTFSGGNKIIMWNRYWVAYQCIAHPNSNPLNNDTRISLHYNTAGRDKLSIGTDKE